MFDVMFSLTECTLPIHAIIVIRSKCDFHQLTSFILIIYHIDPLHNCDISICRLVFILPCDSYRVHYYSYYYEFSRIIPSSFTIWINICRNFITFWHHALRIGSCCVNSFTCIFSACSENPHSFEISD